MASAHADRITGGCLCGDIKYSVAGSALRGILCHCSNCRKITGSAFMANSAFFRSQLTITKGEDLIGRYYDGDTTSGQKLERSFCPRCGSPLFVRRAAEAAKPEEDFISVTTGSMDYDHLASEANWTPNVEYFSADRRSWFPQLEGTTKI